jgi:hypothetical protein
MGDAEAVTGGTFFLNSLLFPALPIFLLALFPRSIIQFRQCTVRAEAKSAWV